jgi:hypothetical protein
MAPLDDSQQTIRKTEIQEKMGWMKNNCKMPINLNQFTVFYVDRPSNTKR